MKKEINDEVKKHKKGKAKGIFKWIGFFLVFQIIYVPILSIALIYYGPFDCNYSNDNNETSIFCNLVFK